MAEDPNVLRRKLGIELRRSRESAGFTQRAAAEELDWSLSKLIRIETGAHRVSVADLRAVLSVYKITDKERIRGLTEAAKSSRGQPWWNEYRDIVSAQFARYLGHEGMASTFQIFHPFLVPGLLHTREYATALLAANPENSRSPRIVDLRIKRQQRLFTQPGLDFTFILDQEALYRWIGGPGVMRRQLEYLVEVSRRPNVSVKIVPFTVGAHPGLRAPFIMLRLKDSPGDLLFFESVTGDQLIQDDASKISEYAEYFEILNEKSLPRERGSVLLEEQIDRLCIAEKAAEADGDTAGR